LLETKRKTAVCVDKVSLFNALCRSVGVPTRYIFMRCEFDFKDNRLPRILPHVVSEVFFNDRWVLMDPTFGALDSKILKLHTLWEPSWIKGKMFWKLRNLPKWLVFVSNIWNRFYPAARRVRILISDYHKER